MFSHRNSNLGSLGVVVVAETLLIVVVVVVALGLVMFLVSKSRTSLRADTPYIRGESIIYDEGFGLCYVKGWERKLGGGYTYRLETELEGVTTKEYSDADLLEPNKHLNIVGRSFIITSKAVGLLAGKVDVVALEDNLRQLKEDLAGLQAKYNYEVSNRESLVNDAFERAGTLLSKMPKGRPK